ncbi:hypothetical protein [Methanospirillum hungatei]|uniref:hypothetical protein n=1 Tax=Methanospirillum hungatei TaxID=2203 RepID=UPI0026ED8190|nr:hypothetical protein [Methanospirillum hungatei]MCA1917152.1 hypothetical protein [Methanospirillum hungatei]
MNTHYSLLFLIILIPAASLSCADSLSSSIVCNGAAFVSSSLISQGQTYAAEFFASDLAFLIRNLNFDAEPKTQTIINATGPLGIDEYSSLTREYEKDSTLCIFDTRNRTKAESSARTLGLLEKGDYSSSRSLPKELTALTAINGSGIIRIRAGTEDENRTTSMKADILGDLNMTEHLTLGGS